MTRTVVLMLFIFLVTFFACRHKQSGTSQTTEATDIQDTSHLSNAVKNIFYSIPTPIETVFLIKNSGVLFEKEILNPIAYLQQYTTIKQKSLNLGIYSLDMCYVNLNHQRDELIAYLAGIKKISSDLGILAGFDRLVVEDIERHIDDHDYIFKQISDRFLKNADQQTLERKITGAYIMIGTYIEGLYVTLHHASRLTQPDPSLMNCLIQQNLTLTKIQSLLSEMKLADLKTTRDQLLDVEKALSKFKLEPNENQKAIDVDIQHDVIEAYHVVKRIRVEYVN